MIRIQSSLEQRSYAEERAKAWQDPHTTEDQRYYGILGEIAVCDILGKPWPKFEVSNGGFDLLINKMKIDVKTKQSSMNSIKGFFEHHVMFDQANKFDPDFYIFCVAKDDLNMKGFWITVCGIIRKSDFMGRAKEAHANKSEMGSDNHPRIAKYHTYQITQGNLDPIHSAESVYNAISDLQYDLEMGNKESRQDPVTQAREEKQDPGSEDDMDDWI